MPARDATTGRFTSGGFSGGSRAGVSILGLEEAEALLERLGSGVEAAGRTKVRVGTDVVYAWGQHFGRYRSGRLARRDGGTFFLTDPFEQTIQSAIRPTLAAAMPQGATAVRNALLSLGMRLQSLAKPLAPVKTGNLRRSIHTEVEN